MLDATEKEYQGYLAWISDHNNNNEADNIWIKES
jgi:hypothetical protein